MIDTESETALGNQFLSISTPDPHLHATPSSQPTYPCINYHAYVQEDSYSCLLDTFWAFALEFPLVLRRLIR